MELFRVDTTADTPESVTLAFVGHMTREHLAEVDKAVTEAAGKSSRVIIDLRSLCLLDRESAYFLCGCSERGVQIVNGPAYVQRWVGQCRGH
ncbi:MAG: hypothetical protein HYX27_00285 [Acidobacteria bacterium]|nr:hypothetical protein [Acidobacteriota bacterium]